MPINYNKHDVVEILNSVLDFACTCEETPRVQQHLLDEFLKGKNYEGYEISDLFRITSKIKADNFIFRGVNTSDHYVTFEGYVFHSKGNYLGQVRRKRNEETLQKVQVWVILVSTVLAACYSLKEIFFSDPHLIESCTHYHIF